MRPDGSLISLVTFSDLMAEFRRRAAAGEWRSDRASSDRWLAPRVHYALRLTRSHASDKGLWQWLAVAGAPQYVKWRWTGDDGVAEDRWYGAIHKQALARLWWGAELFRNGADYATVERAFIRQDLPNSYLHRPLVRCRSFALGILDVLTSQEGEALSAGQVNALARVLNLCTAGSPPEARVDFQVDDAQAAIDFASEDAPLPSSWDITPSGPSASDTTEESIQKGKVMAEHGLALAKHQSNGEGDVGPGGSTAA
jgi:hypothetical protein